MTAEAVSPPPTTANDNNSWINNSIISTDNNDGINRPGIHKNNANIGADNDKPSINKPSNIQNNTGANNINSKRAKFEEDAKKEPMLQTIIDVFDGELL